MIRSFPRTRPWRLVLAGAAAVATVLLVQSTALADPTPVPTPVVPGAPGLPGPVTDLGKPGDSMTTLKATPDVAPAGKKMTLTGTGLPANKDVTIVWMTASVRWVLDPKPDSLDYVGRKVDKFGVKLATARTDANGALKADLKVPVDFGGLHDIYAVVDGIQVAKGGFLVERVVTISPKRGPVGTPITVTVQGMGSPTYESVGGVLWDNRFTGSVSANTTRGLATFKIRAAGPPGTHWIELGGSSHTVPYLNMVQSPVPWTDGHRLKFTVTKDAGAPPNRLEWPKQIKPTIDAKTTLLEANLDPKSTATVKLDSTSGPILSKVSLTAAGLVPSAPVDLVWSTVVGNRVNCTGTCWNFVSVPLGRGTAGADGSLTSAVTIPDGLGGWHVIQVVQAGQVKAQVPYFVKRTFVKAPKVVKAGQPFIVELKGVGWTQIDNTVAVTYDNAYIGYACGFNSNGYVRIQLFATGEPGTHLIDLYPLLYTQQPAYPYSQLGMVPLLGWATDAPGLSAGYELPAFRLAIKVVK
ncbi:MAG: hypothetical protein OEV72_01345 [Thermoleophilia bacterium]|nr:hypothetical protein [Thermoleophilia bacterium]